VAYLSSSSPAVPWDSRRRCHRAADREQHDAPRPRSTQHALCTCARLAVLIESTHVTMQWLGPQRAGVRHSTWTHSGIVQKYKSTKVLRIARP
jgi:hypothetical protein